MAYDKITVPDFGEKISFSNGKMQVPDDPILLFIEGDGIGYDIMTASKRIWDAAVEKAFGGERQISWMEVYAGEKAAGIYDGNYMPEETFEALRDYKVGIKGPLTTPVGGGFRRPECDLATSTGPLQLRETCALVQRRAQPTQASRRCGCGHLPRKHRRYLRRH